MLLEITLAASLSETLGSTVTRDSDIISEILVPQDNFFAASLLTISLSVTIPAGTSPSMIWYHQSKPSKYQVSIRKRNPLILNH